MNITIDTENAAFEDNDGEVARILRKLADSYEGGHRPLFLGDINGNLVGKVRY